MARREETVELRMRSSLKPSKADLIGIHSVIDLLTAIETQIARINTLSISPGGVGGSNGLANNLKETTKAQGDLTKATTAQLDAVKRLNAETVKGGELARRNLKETLKTGRQRLVTTEQRGPGVQFKTTSTGKGGDLTAVSTELDVNYAAIEKSIRRQNEARQRAEATLAKARERGVAKQEAEQKKQILAAERAKAMAQQEINIAKETARLKAEGFRLADHTSELTKKGHQRAQEIYKKDGQSYTVERIFDQKGNLLSASGKAHEAFRNPPIIPPPKLPKPTPSLPSFSQRAGTALAPMNMLGNAAKFMSWYVPAQVIMGSVAAMGVMARQYIEIAAQVQRLSQVFQSSTTSAQGHDNAVQSLANSLLGLASANGRASDEAIQAGIDWSRLGLTHKQVGEAARVSMMGANVAELTTAQTTKHLVSLMASYQFRVGELSGALGVLNNTSNTWNVTNKDLLEGLSRSSAIASQTGMGFLELQGIIGATVGRTGNSGAQIGNALKTVMVRLGTPDIQDMLKQTMDIDIAEKGEGGVSTMRSTSAILSELFVKWQSLNDQMKRYVTTQIAGATQANRFAAIMDTYLIGQRLAIQGALNLNSAEQENVKILASQKAQLIGIRSEWDKTVNLVMTHPNAMSKGLGSLLGWGGDNANQNLVGMFSSIRTMSRLANMHMEGGSKMSGLIMDAASVAIQAKLPWTKGLLEKTGGFSPRRILENITKTPGDKTIEEIKRAQVHTEKGEAFRLQARQFTTVGDLLGQKGGMDRLKELRSMMSPDQFKEIQGLAAGGNISGAQSKLRAMSEKAKQDAVKELDTGKSITDARLADARARLATEDAAGGGTTESLKRQEEIYKEILDLNKQLNVIAVEGGEIFDSEAQRLERLKVLQGQLYTLSQQKTMFSSLGKIGNTNTLDAELAQLRMAEASLKAHLKQLKEDERFDTPKGGEEVAEVTQRLHGVQADIDARTPQARTRAQRMDDMDLMARVTRNQIEMAGTGDGEAAQLMAKIAEARRQAADIGKTEEGIRSQYEAQVVLKDLLIQKSDMQVKLSKELTNTMIEQKRIYGESILMASPADMVRKLMVKRMADANPNMGLGDFLSLDQRSRQDYADYSGHFKKNRILGQIQDLGVPKDFNEQRQEMRAQEDQMRELLGKMGKDIFGAAPDANRQIGANAQAVAIHLGTMRNALMATTAALGVFKEVLASFGMNAAVAGATGQEVVAPPRAANPIEFSGQGPVMWS
jgi:TP901 family phage tail tape measure protein